MNAPIIAILLLVIIIAWLAISIWTGKTLKKNKHKQTIAIDSSEPVLPRPVLPVSPKKRIKEAAYIRSQKKERRLFRQQPYNDAKKN